MVRLIGAIDEFKGAWKNASDIVPERLAALKHVATIESVGSSTRIEGATLSNDEVEKLLQGLSTQSFQTRDEQEVAGYAEIMQAIFEAYEVIPLAENHIKQLHGNLLKYSSKDDRHRGQYKTVANHVEATDVDGRKWVIFETASVFDTPFKMTELINWLDENLADQHQHPLLVTAAFIVEFLAIHPFQDGNGRLSRALTTLLLLKSGYAYVPFSSLESVVESNKENYYLNLRKTQQSLGEQSPDWDSWFLFFLQAMHKQMERLREKLDRESILAPSLSALAVQVMDLVREKGSVQMSDLEKALGGSRSTIKSKVQELVTSGHLIRHGQARATWYTAKSGTTSKRADWGKS
jgi:Fic family protein